MLLHQDGRPGWHGPFMWKLKSKIMSIIESLNEADTIHRCHQLVYVNLSTPLQEVIPHMASMHRALYNNILFSEGGGAHNAYPFTENVTIIRSSKWLHTPSLATYKMRALQTTTAVLGRVGQINQCITPLGMSLYGDPWKNITLIFSRTPYISVLPL